MIASPSAARTTPASLAEHAGERSWSPDELAWDDPVERISVPHRVSLLSSLMTRMTEAERDHARQLEVASHLGALADGERKAVELAAETVLLCPESKSDVRWFLGTLLADEAKHDLVLHRLLTEKLAWKMRPHPVIDRLFEALSRERDFELNLLAGQVVLEGAAATLLNGMLLGVDQPLLREILRNIGRDEARHIRFAHVVCAPVAELPTSRRKRMEEVLFDAAHAALESLVPEDTWETLGLDRRAAREASVDSLRERGVITFFTKIVARELTERGFSGEALRGSLEGHLEARLRSAA
jgi:hypothetical protein